jgi:hypothetical protein
MRVFKGEAVTEEVFLESMATLADSISANDVKASFANLRSLETKIKGFRKKLIQNKKVTRSPVTDSTSTESVT